MNRSSGFDDIRAEIEWVKAAVAASTDGPPKFRLLPSDPGLDRLARSVQALASALEQLTDIVEGRAEHRGETDASE
jgi:hypothetical protein